jgi:hypothetical protein
MLKIEGEGVTEELLGYRDDVAENLLRGQWKVGLTLSTESPMPALDALALYAFHACGHDGVWHGA